MPILESRAKNGTLTLTAGTPGTPLDVVVSGHEHTNRDRL